MRYICSVCGYVYDESKSIPQDGIPAGTRWEALPENWVCPLCGAAKQAFNAEGATAAPQEKSVSVLDAPEDARELNAMELSAICSNLARGCEKQYRAEEQAKFTQLANYFKAAAKPVENAEVNRLTELIHRDLNSGFESANAHAGAQADRGAKRALVWSEKVTRILASLLERYAREGERMLENTGVYVCTICGFVFVGDNPPALCPVCKVPGWKFEKVEGR